MSESGDVTRILERINGGEPGAVGELFEAVYAELRRLAARHMSNERDGHTLQATALVNEAFLRLARPDGAEGPGWRNSRHFFAAAAEAMRKILVDHARRTNAAKRGGPDAARRRLDVVQLDPPHEESAEVDGQPDLEALDRALGRLRAQDERRYQVVMYRYFAGRTNPQIAEMLGVAEKTVQRDWHVAKVILLADMTPNHDAPSNRD